MTSLRRYTESDVEDWNEFIENSKNGTFLFMRGYMDYHSDRFKDHSLMYFDGKGKLIGVLPGNERDGVYYSHQGLTYGGLVLTTKARMVDVLEMFSITKEYLRGQGFKQMVYKSVPYIYDKYMSEEEDYALFRSGAVLDVCNISTTIDLKSENRPRMEERRLRGCKKAKKMGYNVRETDDIGEMWHIVEQNLNDTYNVKPVHSLEEMRLLKSRFPNEIRCFVAEREGVVEGGIVLFEMMPVAHSQYPHATVQGKSDGVMDLVMSTVIEKYTSMPGMKYFDFGNSNEDAGRYLNENLIAQKEGFGGRGVSYKIYRIDL